MHQARGIRGGGGPFDMARMNKPRKRCQGEQIFLTDFVQISDDDTVGPDHFYNVWGRTIQGLAKSNRWDKSFDCYRENKVRMQEAGFVDVVERKFMWPIGGWHRDPKLKYLGQLNEMRIIEGLEGFALRLLTTVGNVSPIGHCL